MAGPGRKKLEGPGVNYFQLPRKQLQSLCKKYGFPANKTNQLMAEFLTSHLNSDEYLNRDKSIPSPAVKTRFQCRDEEPTTEENLPTISELQPTITETQGRNLSHDFVSIVAEETDSRTSEASKTEKEETGHGPIQISPATGGGFPSEEAVEFTNSGFRIRDSCLLFKRESRQGTPLRYTTSEGAMDCTVKGSEVEGSASLGSLARSGHLSTSEEAIDTATIGTHDLFLESQKAPCQETPLPLSVMPFVRPITPDSRAFSDDKGVKLFVDLKDDGGLLPGENLRDYYRAWGAPLTLRTEQDKFMQEDVSLRSLKTFEGSESINRSAFLESQLATGHNRTDRAEKEEDGMMNPLLQQVSTASVSCSKKTDAIALKSCLLTPNRKLSSSPLNVSFLCPPIFSSPRTINGSAGRSEIVKEWSDDQVQEKMVDQINEIACSEKEKAANDDLVLEKLDEPSPLQDSLAKEPSESNERTPRQSAADLESPPVGIVEKVVGLFEEHRRSSLSRGPSSLQRKDSYKSSPFVKSSRIAAELERATKLGQTRRVGILALKRAMGVVPLFTDSTMEDVEKESPPRDGAISSPVLADSSSIEGVVAADDANTGNTPLVESVEPLGVEADKISETAISPCDIEVEVTPKPLFSSTDNPLVVTGDATPNEVTILSIKEEDPLVVSTRDAVQDEEKMHSIGECLDEKDEQTIAARIDATTNISNTEESEAPVAADEEAVNLPPSVEESVSNLSWMTKPIQLPTRRPANHKLKEKPGRPFSTSGRTLELMEKTSAKLKMLKKSTTVREAAVSRPKTRTFVAEVEESKIRGSAQQVEPAGEVTIVEQAAEDSVTRLEEGLRTSSQLEMDDSTERSHQRGEEKSYIVGGYTREEISNETSAQNGKMSSATDEEKNVHGHPEMIESVSMERRIVCEGDLSKSEEKKASDKPTVALSFLDIDFTQIITVEKPMEVLQPESVLEIDSTTKVVRERTTEDNKSIPSSPLGSNRITIDTKVPPSSPNATTPTKPSGLLLDVLSECESEGKNNVNSPSLYGKENEWSKRQEQHKTPLTGRSKDKALRYAEIKASNLREQLLRKRRGMMEQEQTDGLDSSSIQLSPLKQLATNIVL